MRTSNSTDLDRGMDYGHEDENVPSEILRYMYYLLMSAMDSIIIHTHLKNTLRVLPLLSKRLNQEITLELLPVCIGNINFPRQGVAWILLQRTSSPIKDY